MFSLNQQKREGLHNFLSTLQSKSTGKCYLLVRPVLQGLPLEVRYDKYKLDRVVYMNSLGQEACFTERLGPLLPQRLIAKGKVFGGFKEPRISVFGTLTVDRHLFKGTLGLATLGALHATVTQQDEQIWVRRTRYLAFAAHSLRTPEKELINRLGELDLLAGVPFLTPHASPAFLCRDIGTLSLATVEARLQKVFGRLDSPQFPYPTSGLVLEVNSVDLRTHKNQSPSHYIWKTDERYYWC